jgi:hypothetical protein
MGETRDAYRVLLEKKPDVKDHIEDMGVNGQIILKHILHKKKWKSVD